MERKAQIKPLEGNVAGYEIIIPTTTNPRELLFYAYAKLVDEHYILLMCSKSEMSEKPFGIAHNLPEADRKVYDSLKQKFDEDTVRLRAARLDLRWRDDEPLEDRTKYAR